MPCKREGIKRHFQKYPSIWSEYDTAITQTRVQISVTYRWGHNTITNTLSLPVVFFVLVWFFVTSDFSNWWKNHSFKFGPVLALFKISYRNLSFLFANVKPCEAGCSCLHLVQVLMVLCVYVCFQAQIAFLQGERKGQENLKKDLVRRIKMLEYALKQERSEPSTYSQPQ